MHFCIMSRLRCERGAGTMWDRDPARFVCADLAEYEELTSALLDDDHLGVARIVSHVALRPVRRFGGYPEKLIGRNLTRR